MKALTRICLTVAMLAAVVGTWTVQASTDTPPVYYLALATH